MERNTFKVFQMYTGKGREIIHTHTHTAVERHDINISLTAQKTYST